MRPLIARARYFCERRIARTAPLKFMLEHAEERRKLHMVQFHCELTTDGISGQTEPLLTA